MTIHFAIDDGLGTLRLTNGATNAITLELVTALSDALARARRECRGLRLLGGEKFFCNGLDLPRLLAWDRATLGEFFLRFNQAILDLIALPIPTVCGARAHAIGAGKTLLLACDYAVAASGRVLVGLPEINLGVPNPYLGEQLLRLVAGDRLASDLLYSGAMIDSTEAQRRGLVHDVVGKDDVEARALERLTALSRLVPAAFAATKANRVEPLLERYKAHFRAKHELFLDVWFSPPSQALLREGAKKF